MSMHGACFAYARMHRTPRKTNAMCSQTTVTAVDHERAIPKTHQLRTVSRCRHYYKHSIVGGVIDSIE